MTSSLQPPPPPPPPDPSLPAMVVRSNRASVWIGVSLAAVGVLASVAWAGLQLFLLDRDVDELTRAVASSPTDFDVDATVSWTVFAEPRDESLSGVRYRIVDAVTGEESGLAPYGGDFAYSTGSHSGRAVSTVQLQPGRYRLVVEGPLTIAVGPSPAGRMGWMFGGAAAVGGPLLIGGLAVALISAIRDTRARTRAALPPPASPWSAGEWPPERGS